MKPNLKHLVRTAQTFVTKNSPQILMGVGIIGMGVTVFTAVKSTPKALQLIEEKKEELEVEELTPVETVKAAWKCYIPAAITGGLSVACLLSSNSINTRRAAALGAAYNVTKIALEEYKDAIVETVGENTAKEIRSKITEKKAEKIPSEKNTVIVAGEGDILCYDSLSGRLFISNIDKVNKAVNDLNRNIIEDMYASLNDFYDILGLDSIELGELLGWHIDDGRIEIEYDAMIQDNKPCVVLNYNVAPRYEYYKICR